MSIRSIIFGATGQDAYFLSKLLLARGDKLTCCHKINASDRSLYDFTQLNGIKLEACDMHPAETQRLISLIQPDEIYNLAAISSVANSFKSPLSVISNNINSHLGILEAVREFSKDSKIYYAGSSEELIGVNARPTSPYGVSKDAVRSLNDIYRRSYGLFIVHAQNFNHSSYRQSPEFLFGKVIRYVANLSKNMDAMYGNWSHYGKLKLGNLNSYRSISYAEDVMRAAILLMGQKEDGNCAVHNKELTHMQNLVMWAFEYIHHNYRDFVEFDATLVRPSEDELLRLPPDFRLRGLGWKPSCNTKELVEMSIDKLIDNTFLVNSYVY